MTKTELTTEIDAFVAARLSGNELLARRQLKVLNELMEKLPEDLTPHVVAREFIPAQKNLDPDAVALL